MPKRLSYILFLALALAAGQASAFTLDLNLSDDAAEFKLAWHKQTGGEALLETQVSWLHEQDNGDLLGLG
ncbi:hypothetical protein, partial [Natronospira sp.]